MSGASGLYRVEEAVVMGKHLSMADVLKLSVAERIQLVGDIWDSIAAVPDSVSLSEAQREELDRRLEAYHRDPGPGSPWDAVKARIRGRA
jgi:putative addiction module component (TIGR02574 family)